MNMEKKPRGRPKRHDNAADRTRAYRLRKQEEGRRFDVYLPSSASWRLTGLAAAWNCSKGQAIDRLIMEADERYHDILFPET